MKKQNLYAVILAGGAGTRFWPLSRKANPKQFLEIVGKGSLFEQSLARIRPLVDPENILIVTGQAYKNNVLRSVKAFGIPKGNILLEPQGKNTAPAICWAAGHIFAKNRDAVMVVLPADHLVLNPRDFLKHINEAIELAGQQYLVTLGIVPTRPETGYGYIRGKLVRSGKKTFYEVDQFIEKPPLEKARVFIKQKGYFWNSGMFVWRADQILTEFSIQQPQIYSACFAKTRNNIMRQWMALPNISVDYAILEKAERVAVIPAADMKWSDLGSWESLAAVVPKNMQGNYLKGRIKEIDCRNTLIYGEKRIIAAIGLEDIVIVDTPEALLVCRKEFSQKVKTVVEALEKTEKAIV